MKHKFLLLFLLIPQLVSAYYVNHPCCDILQPCGWWGSAEYMYAWRKHRFFPALVTTNPTAPPILGDPGTTVLFGDEFVGGNAKSSFRADFGVWISRCIGAGISGYSITQEEIKFSLDGGPTGTPIFGQPFFNTLTGVQSVNLLSFPGAQINGHIDIEANNRIWSFDLYARYRFLGSCCFKFDLLAGFLYNSLTDNLVVNTFTSGIIPPLNASVSDNFSVKNQFYSGLIGFVAEWRSCSWAVNVIGKVGLGNMHRHVEISGFTAAGLAGTSTIIGSVNSGFLAQPSNIGTHTHTQFEAVSQISTNIQLKIWPHIWATLGYTYIFWPSVDLAGNQIDLNINPTQIIGLIGAPAPLFHENPTSFWAQGVTAGLYFCY